MEKPYKFFIVDDDRVTVELLAKILRSEGQIVAHTGSSLEALSLIDSEKPDCVLLDIMMPEIDGLELCQRIRKEKSSDDLKVVIVSGKSYEFDRNRAFSFGADGYITKPINTKTFFQQLEKIIVDKINLTFWGVRGTLPVPGNKSTKYGGNTSCMSLDFARGQFFIFDAGTGIKELSDYLMIENRFPLHAKIFISHPHWDHINALPFFVPLYLQGNEFEIIGPSHGDVSMHDLISGQMDGVHFPIKIKEFSANVLFRDLMEEEIQIDNILVRTMLLNHPGHCLGYRVMYKSRSVCYITDNEIFPENSPYHNPGYSKKLEEFIHRTDALIIDCTYHDEEYENKSTWGHSAVSEVVNLADRAEVETLFLFHHDPDQTDADIDAKVEAADKILNEKNSSVRCIAPREKEVFRI